MIDRANTSAPIPKDKRMDWPSAEVYGVQYLTIAVSLPESYWVGVS